MPRKARININLFAHILLDSESNGRFGVQGNLFENTLTYLAEYIRERLSTNHQLDENLEKINHFVALMDDLVSKERMYYNLSATSLEIFEEYALKIKAEIQSLTEGQTVLLPGGWPSHAIIYQFEKNKDNEIIFSIFNAGSGLQFHEKISSKVKELFASQKSWLFKISTHLQEDEFLILIKQLMAEVIPGHPLQTLDMNATKLYRLIEKSCCFLDAISLKILSVDNLEQATTGAQLAGTCSQRSIHQMLKLKFDTLDNYKKFIFEFQSFALHDYLTTHPAPRSKAISDFVSKGIENMLKILDEIQQFTLEEKLLEANKLKQTLDSLDDSIHYVAKIKPIMTRTAPYVLDESRSKIKLQIEKPSIRTSIPVFESFLFTDSQQFVYQKIVVFYHQCLENQDTNPIWVIESIQDFMSKLPLPRVIPDLKFHYYAHLSSEEIEAFLKFLSELRTIYITCRNKILDTTIHARDFATLLSIYALYDFLSYDEIRSSIHHYRAYQYIKTGYVDKLEQSSLIANQRPQLDLRVSEVFDIYKDVSEPITNLKQAVINLLRSSFSDNPEIAQELKQLYNQYIKKHQLSNETVLDFAKEQVPEIYYILKQFTGRNYYQSIYSNSPLQAHKFSVMLKKIQRSLNYLHFLSVGLEPQIKQQLCFFSSIVGVGGSVQEYFCEDIFHRMGEKGYPCANITRIIPCPSYYPLTKSSVEDALLRNHFNGYPNVSNAIQMSMLANKDVNAITKSDYVIAGLSHKRTAVEYQIIIILHELTLNIERLADKNLQIYVEDNIFQRTLLYDAFQRDAQLEEMGEYDSLFMNKFNIFIQRGLQYFQSQDGYLNEDALFFIMLKVKVYLYQTLIPVPQSKVTWDCELFIGSVGNLSSEGLRPATCSREPEILPHEQSAGRRESNCQHALVKTNNFDALLLMLNTHLKIEKKSKILGVLHQFRFLTLQNKLNLQQQLAASELAQLYESYVYYQFKGGFLGVVSDAFKYEITSQEIRFQAYLQRERFNFDNIYSCLQLLGFDRDSDTFHEEYPLIYISKNKQEEYVFHIEEGRLYKDGKTISPMPLALLTHPLVKFFNFNEKTSCLISEDGKTITFFEPQAIKFILNDKDQVIIAHKLWNIDGVEHWYELRLLSCDQAKTLKTIACSSEKTHLPLVLLDRFQAWICLDKYGHDFIAKDHQPQYGVDEWKNLYVLTYPTLKLTAPFSNSSLNKFEDIKFSLWNIDHYQNGYIHLPRYGLDFSVIANNRTYFSSIFSRSEDILIELNGTDFQLKDSQDFLPEGTAYLFLENAVTKQQQCMVAVQAYYFDSSRAQLDGEYYRLSHDHQQIINERILNKLFEGVKGTVPKWNYQHSEKIIIYPIKDGLLSPQNAADSLYLCYVYMANHEYEKAWNLLTNMKLQNLIGSYEEFSYLHMILQWLPFINKDEESEQKAVDEGPECISCQLKVLALYLDFLCRGNRPEFPIVNVKKSANDYVQASICQTRQAFYKDLPAFIEKQYKRLQRLKRHLPERYQLSDEERRLLLNYYKNHSVSNIHGALGYEIMQLNLKALIKTLQLLNNLQTRVGALPPAMAKELAMIEEKVQSEQKILKTSTKLINSRLDLNLTIVACNKSLLNNNEMMIMDSLERSPGLNIGAQNIEHIEQAVLELRSSINQETFLRNFRVYYQIALNKEHIYHQQLKIFCIKYLISHRHQSLKDQPNNIPFLCNILYRAMELNKNIYCARMSDLVTKLQAVIPAPIYVLEARDVFEEELTSVKEIASDLLNSALPLESIMVESYISPFIMDKIIKKVLVNLDSDDFSELDQFLSAYKSAEAEYQRTIHTITDVSQELIAGKAKYACINQQATLANKTLTQKNIVMQLIHHSRMAQQSLKSRLLEWDLLVSQVNLHLTHHDAIKIYSSQKQLVTKEKLLQCYFNSNLASYAEILPYAFNDKSRITELNQLVHELVHDELAYQHHTRLINAFEQGLELTSIANIMMSTNHAGEDPMLMFFQIKENILLHQRQIQALDKLLESPVLFRYQECIEKIIMGGGKSKIILPCMVQKKANGLNLVIVEITKALFATNHADLNQISQQLFQQKAIKFEFDRDSDDSVQRLREIYDQFKDIIINKNYLVTTGEAIQSLQLKYIERLFDKPLDKLTDWSQKIQLFENILGILKNQGDVVLDEVHQGLLLKKKLNYTIGESKPLEDKIIQNTLKLYSFLTQLSFEQQQDLSIEKQLAIWPDLLVEIATRLINHPQSPLRNIFAELCEYHDKSLVAEVLINYFENRELSSLITGASQATREILALYKEQIHMLQQTLNRHHREHYGPSKNPLKSPLQKRIAIPYAANEKPNERSQFGNVLEILNYTIQSLLADGIDDDLLIFLFLEFQANARVDFHQSGELVHSLDETLTGVEINVFLQGTGLTIANIDLDNSRHIYILREHLSYNAHFLFYILQQKILSQIHVDTLILHSDAYNHVDIYHTVQGLSGTPWNHSTYHQRLSYNTNTSIGTDGYIQTLLKEKHTQIRVHDFTDLDKLMDQCLTPNLRAIIDISATLSGENLKIAQGIARILHKNKSSIKYVLYFDDHDLLCAISLKKPANVIIIGKSSPKEIADKLHCSPAERFTYYDQAHTVGTDILQAPEAHALCFVNQKTYLQNFLQGAMRMRQLFNQQTIDILVPSDLSIDQLEILFQLMHEREQEQIKQDNFIACISQMDNLIRQDFLQIIYDIPVDDIEKKSEFALKFQNYLLKKNEVDLLKRYEKITLLTDTKILLEKHRDYLLTDWQICVGADGISEQLSREMNTLITTLYPKCHVNSMLNSQNQGDEVEIETQKEIEVAVELEFFTDTSLSTIFIKPKPYIAWTHGELMRLFFQLQCSPRILCLNQLFVSCSLFSKDLMCTYNYAYTYESQKKLICKLIKPADFVFWTLINQVLIAYVVDPQEVNDISCILKKSNCSLYIWISSSDGSLLAGNRPSQITADLEYQRLLEQINFFGGKLNWFLEQSVTHNWLQEHTAEKLAFFKKELYPYRETSQNDLTKVANMLIQNMQTSKGVSPKHTDIYPKQQDKLFSNFRSSQLVSVDHGSLKANTPITVDDLSYQEYYFLFRKIYGKFHDTGITEIILFMNEQNDSQSSDHEKYTQTVNKIHEIAKQELLKKPYVIMTLFGYKRSPNVQKLYETMADDQISIVTAINYLNDQPRFLSY